MAVRELTRVGKVRRFWCETCGKTTKAPGDCPECEKWWKDNPPPAT